MVAEEALKTLADPKNWTRGAEAVWSPEWFNEDLHPFDIIEEALEKP